MIKLNHHWKGATPKVIDAANVTYRPTTNPVGHWIVTLTIKAGFSHNSELIASAVCDTEEERDAVVANIKDVLHARSST